MKSFVTVIAIIMALSAGLINIFNKKDIATMNEKYYKGTMPGGYNFDMTLKRSGNNLSGSVLNTYSNITSVKGLMDDENNFMLREYEQEKITGIYKGTIFPEGRIKGVWSSPDGMRRLPFNMVQEVKTPPSRSDGFSVGHLGLKKLTSMVKGE